MSDSEAEDLPESQVTLPQNYGSRLKNSQIAIRLVVSFIVTYQELGPRLTLELVKIEDGLMTGLVVYHQYLTKTEREIGELNAKFKMIKKQKREEEQKAKEKEEKQQQKRDEQAKKRQKHKEEEDLKIMGPRKRDRKSTRLNSSHIQKYSMPSSD